MFYNDLLFLSLKSKCGTFCHFKDSFLKIYMIRFLLSKQKKIKKPHLDQSAICQYLLIS